MNDVKVSGNIYASENKRKREGENYLIIQPVTNQGWGLPVEDIEPDDLRILADRIEAARAKHKDAN